VNPLKFGDEIWHPKTRIMGLPEGVSFIILSSTVFVWSTCMTDRQTDRRTDKMAIAYTRYSIYAVARKNLNENEMNDLNW